MEMHMEATKPSQPIRIRDHKYSRIVVQGLPAMHMSAIEPSRKRNDKPKCDYSADVVACPDRQEILERSEYMDLMEMHMEATKPSQPVRISDRKYSRIVVQGLPAMDMSANEPSHKRSGKLKCDYSADVVACPDRQELLKRSEYIVRTFIMPQIQSNQPKLDSTTELAPSSNCFNQFAHSFGAADGKKDVSSDQTEEKGLIGMHIDDNNEASPINFSDQYTVVNGRNVRFKCNHCGKEVSKAARLKYHLGGVRQYIQPCPDVPPDIRKVFRHQVLLKEKEEIERSIIFDSDPPPPVRRKISPSLNCFPQSEPKRSATNFAVAEDKQVLPSGMHMDGDETLPVDIIDQYTLVNKRNSRIKCNHCGKEMHTRRLKSHLGGVKGVVPCPNVPPNIRKQFRCEVILKKSEDLDKYNVVDDFNPCSNQFHQYKPENHAPNSDQTKSITSFFLQGLVDLKVANSPSLEQIMLSTISEDKSNELKNMQSDEDVASDQTEEMGLIGMHTDANSPSLQQITLSTIGKDKSDEFNNMQSNGDLNGQIPQDKLQKLKDYVDGIKQSWSSSGCSILVDGWRSEEGQELVTFLVDCPCGPIYLQSSDVSSVKDNVDALYGMVNEVVEKIGEHNVVQVVASSTTGWMGTLGEQFIERRKTMFWSTSASHCINLMLEKIGMLEHVKVILEKAKNVLELIENSGGLNLNLVKPLKMDSGAVQFQTLEKIVLEKNKLEELVNDPCFWKVAAMVVKATKPLVNVGGDGKLLTGYIYEAMDQAKETIQEELKSEEESYYVSLWNIIDEIWDNDLHSPLHAAGYYLNPSLFCSSNFHLDKEVVAGLHICIVRMFGDHRTQDLIDLQLDDYRLRRGAFWEACTPENRSIPPLEWWAKYGGECPELQNFATRVLSQTCDGASRYGLTRQMAERVLLDSCGSREKQSGELQDPAFVHYNQQLHYLNLMDNGIGG